MRAHAEHLIGYPRLISVTKGIFYGVGLPYFIEIGGTFQCIDLCMLAKIRVLVGKGRSLTKFVVAYCPGHNDIKACN